ncbi:MAG: hypothetical protein BMS9Abin08_1086 [Gammaproteobacteria bacterium]|nr:MAG: hypothetical protein BMS9Abin08_1086 [Gammaproteobacteria bacterium]
MKTITTLLVTVFVSALVTTENSWASRVSHHDHDYQHNKPNYTAIDHDEIIQAETGSGDVVFEKAEHFKNKTYFTNIFSIDTAGTYEVTLTDFEFPNSLGKSGLNIATGTDSLAKLFGPGSFTFDAVPGNYYVSFFAKAGPGPIRDMDFHDIDWTHHQKGYHRGGMHLGQYGIQISLTNPVPLPAAAWLFGSGLIGLTGIAWRKKQATSEATAVALN